MTEHSITVGPPASTERTARTGGRRRPRTTRRPERGPGITGDDTCDGTGDAGGHA